MTVTRDEWIACQPGDVDRIAPPVPDPAPSGVWLFPEYSPPAGFVPRWPSSGATDALLPADLLERLLAWQADVDAHYGVDVGWDSHESRDRRAETSKSIETDVRNAFGGQADLVCTSGPRVRNNDGPQKSRSFHVDPDVGRAAGI